MDRSTRRNFAPVYAAGVGLLLCLGCGREASPPAEMDLPGPRRIYASKSPARHDFAAPALLTDSEVASAEPLVPQAAACDYRAASAAPSVVATITGPAASARLYAPEYDETQVWKGAEGGPAATITEVQSNRSYSWISGSSVSPSFPALGAFGPSVNAPIESRPAMQPPICTSIDRAVATPASPEKAVDVRSSGPSSPLPWSQVRATGREFDTARRQADETVRRALALAERGALFSAQSDLIQAMRDLAQALDASQETPLHTQALAFGLRAVQEADDFLPKGARIETQLPMTVLIASHQTPLLKSSPGDWTPQQARQQYQAYAQEQLAAALGNEPIGSLSLFALAKVQAAIDAKKPSDSGAGLARAMTYHRAALLVEPDNFLAANDLGVLLARQGRLEEARAALEKSLSVSPQVATWQNLAVVHQTLKQTELARQSQQQAELLAQHQPASARGSLAVQWLDATSFAQTSGNGPIDVSSPASARVAQTPGAAGDDKHGKAATPIHRN